MRLPDRKGIDGKAVLVVWFGNSGAGGRYFLKIWFNWFAVY
jgi:hypothetical protein